MRERGCVGRRLAGEAWKAEAMVNLVYRKTARNFNPGGWPCAGAFYRGRSRDAGRQRPADPDSVHTPGILVKRMVAIRIPPSIEQSTVRARELRWRGIANRWHSEPTTERATATKLNSHRDATWCELTSRQRMDVMMQSENGMPRHRSVQRAEKIDRT